jgi:hypothetical protein
MERKGKGAQIIEFPARANAPTADFTHAKDAHDAAILRMPVKTLEKHEALEELGRIVGPDEMTPNVFFLAFPDTVRSSAFPGGVEFYDMETERPSGRHAEESMLDIGRWVTGWYLSVFEKGDLLICRYINNDPACTLACRVLQQPVYDPSARYRKYTLESFIDTLIYGDPPD